MEVEDGRRHIALYEASSFNFSELFRLSMPSFAALTDVGELNGRTTVLQQRSEDIHEPRGK